MNPPRRLARKLFKFTVWFCLIAAGLVAIRVLYSFRDRSPGYVVDLKIDGKAARRDQATVFRAGFGRVKINPDVSNPARPVWLAGFDNNRSATGIHDDLWAIAAVLDDGRTRVGLVVLDSIGFMHDDVVAVRQRLMADWRIDYAMVCATHNHSTPDLMGIWGPSLLKTGVDPAYREQVIAASAQALGDAVAGLQPAAFELVEIPTPPAGLVNDTRKPEVFDPDLRLMLFRNLTNTAMIGSIVSWANHPEVLWSGNREITADFCGTLRDAIEKGVTDGGRSMPGMGGIPLFVNGAVGGLMTPNPSLTVRDPFLNTNFSKPSFEKSRALGRSLALRIHEHVAATPPRREPPPDLSVFARTVELPLDNRNFLLAPVLGLIDRGHVRWGWLRSELAFLEVGDASIVCIPGEIYPELVNGGIVRAPGGDFDCDPVEIPPLREMMPGRVKFVFGLANDEVGYIIPKSEWDEKPPYLYGAHHAVYGEVNSLGPRTAGLIHQGIRELITVSGRNKPSAPKP